MALVRADCTFRSGQFGVSFDMTGLSDTTALLVKDSTHQVYYVHQVYLACASSAAVAIYDGSTSGNLKVGHLLSSAGPDLGGALSLAMDFGKDAIVFDDYSTICISAGAGAFWGFLKYSIGNQ